MIIFGIISIFVVVSIKKCHMEEEKKRKVTIDIVKANVFAIILMAVAAIVLLIPFYKIWGFHLPEGSAFGGITGLVLIIVIIFAGIALHEFIHGLTWACFAKNGWRSIRFGVMWKMLTPYCHCSDPLPIPSYALGGIMPCNVLGIIPAIVALCVGSLILLLWSIFFISAAAGDIWIVWLLTKEKRGSTVLDHPSEAGFYIIEPDDAPTEATQNE